MRKSLKRTNFLVSLGLAVTTITTTIPGQVVMADTSESPSSIESQRSSAKYTVSFNLGEGGRNTSQQYNSGTTLVNLNNEYRPQFSGDSATYTFGGWYKDPACTIALTSSDRLTSNVTLYAKWDGPMSVDSDRYQSINFNYMGGLPYTVNGVDLRGASMPFNSNIIMSNYGAPQKPGYEFAGWYQDSQYTMPFPDGAKIYRDMTIYAKWVKEEHTVSFNLNGGVGSVPAQSVEDGSKATAPTTVPTRNGYIFDGWYANSALTTPFNFGTTAITADTTIYAKWKRAYTLSYDLKGGEGNFPTQTYGQGSHPVEPTEIPTKEGYDFVGWYINNTTPMDFDTWVMNQSGGVFAKWAVSQHDVTFNLNGGEGSFPTQSITHNGTITAPTTEPTKEGKVFMGWYADAGLTTPVDFNTQITADTTLYAKWATGYTLSFDLQGGEGNFPTQTIAEGSHPVEPTEIPTKEGYNFVGWYINNTTPMDFDTWVMNRSGGVFAKWEKADHEVSFNLNGGVGSIPTQTIEDGGVITAPTTEPTRNGYLFDGWYTDSTLTTPVDFDTYTVTEATTLYAKWNRAFTLAFNLNGGEGDFPTQTIVSGGNPTEPTDVPTKEGYDFAGWYVNGNLTIPMDFDTWEMAKNGSVFAKWVVASHDVTFNLNGGEGDFPTQAVNHNGTVTAPTVEPTKEFHTFDGWYTDAALTNPVDFTTPITADTTLYAKWTAQTTYTLGFVLNGGVGDFPTQRIVAGENPIEPDTVPTKEGYDFVGWYVNSRLTIPMDFETWEMNNSGNVFAKWERRTHEISFDLNGGEGEFPAQTINEGETVTAPIEEPTREGYRFVGWYSDGNLTIPMDFEGLSVMQDGTIFAKWEPLPTYSVNFNINNGLGDFPIQTIIQGGKVVEPTTEPTKDGYAFMGWYADTALTTEFDFENTEINRNTTIYAKWVQTFTLGFNLNGGEGDFPTQTIVSGGKTIAPTTVPTKEGYDFIGWYMDGNLTTPMDFDTFEISRDGNVFAKWERRTHEISFDLNGGEGEIPTQTINEGENIVAPSVEPTREGYRFAGWYSDGALTRPINFEEFSVMQDGTVFAKWIAIPTHTLAFDLNGGEGEFPTQTIYEGENPIRPEVEPTREGYNFAGWYVDGNLTIPMDFETWEMEGSGTVFAKWELKEYTLTFDYNGGTGDIDTQEVSHGENPGNPTTPRKPGYAFAGWYYMDNGTPVTVDLDTYVMTDDVTMYAKWRPTNVRYTLRFNLNGGRGSFPAQSILEGGTPTEPDHEPTKEGYTFGGWYLDEELTMPVVFDSWFMYENKTIHAKWIAN